MRAEIREAQADDDAGIRRLLREEAMPGRIQLTYEREPDFFAGCALMGEGCRTLVASRSREDQGSAGQIVGIACRCTREVYINGEARRIGYLGQLRVASSARGQWLVSRGFAALRRMHEDDPVPAYLLSIVEGNREAAGVLLHKPRPGFPILTEAAQYRTLAMAVRRIHRAPTSDTDIRPPAPEELDELIAFLNAQARRYQLADVWTPARLLALAEFGLTLNDLRIVRARSEIVAVAALWDQHRFKQTVVRGYGGALGRVRPVYNLVMRLQGKPVLPAPGESLQSGYLALLYVKNDDAVFAERLLRVILAEAAARGFSYLIMGFDVRDPLLRVAARQTHVPYLSRLYLAQWPDRHGQSGGFLGQFDRSPGGHAVHVEAATL